MLISNLNLYKAGWLDLVFENRNKEYGAYELRSNNGRNTVRAMGITFFGVGLLCGASIIFSHPVKTTEHGTVVIIDPSIAPRLIQPPKKIEPPFEAKLKPHPIAPKITINKNIPPVVVIDTKADKPVVTINIKGAIGTEDVKGKEQPGSVIPDTKTGTGTGTTPVDDESVHPMGTLDVMPEPVGGDKAWASFLNKNLRFPGEAQDQGVSGKVFLSFIIEKDGHLSNIMLINKAGYGFDEEALRVLKLAKAWKPGIANGQPVRVKFTLPINFQVAEQ